MGLIKNTEQRNTRVFILEQATPLFAAHGYNGVSMRDISKAAGMSAAALYHHFSDKKALYLEVMTYAFTNKMEGIIDTLNVDDTPLERLTCFIERFTHLIASDPNYRALVQRELLDNDETRLRLVAEQVFLRPFQAVRTLTEDLFPDCDPHMLVISMVGLVLFHFETTRLRTFLPGWRPEHSDPKNISKHLMQLLINGLDSDHINSSEDAKAAKQS